MSGIGILTRECLSFPLFAEQVWEGLPQDIHQRSTQIQSSMIFFSQNDPDCCVTFVQICLWKSSERVLGVRSASLTTVASPKR